MAILTRSILTNLGIELSDENYQALAEHFNTTLSERVINEIVLGLTPEQAAELANLENAGDEAITTWLSVNVKDLNEIVTDEVDILLGEIAENGENI